MSHFRQSVLDAKVCVVVGYSHRNAHITGALDHALDAGLAILDVNPGGPCSRYMADARYRHLGLGAKSALVDGRILSELDAVRE